MRQVVLVASSLVLSLTLAHSTPNAQARSADTGRWYFASGRTGLPTGVVGERYGFAVKTTAGPSLQTAVIGAAHASAGGNCASGCTVIPGCKWSQLTPQYGGTYKAQPADFDDCGKLPPGLTISCSSENGNCHIEGSPTQSGKWSFDLVAAWIDGESDPTLMTWKWIKRTFTIEVERPGLNISPSSGSLPDGQEDRAYFQHFEIEGGTPPYTVRTLHAPPDGLTFDKTAMTLRGRPAEARVEPYPFSFQVRDAKGMKLNAKYRLRVLGPEGGQLKLEVSLLHAVKAGSAQLTVRATVASIGTESTNPTKLELSIRSKSATEPGLLELIFNTKPAAPEGASCSAISGSGTHAVHVSCDVPRLEPHHDYELTWTGHTGEVPKTEGYAHYTVVLTGTVGKGSRQDQGGDNSDASTVEIRNG